MALTIDWVNKLIMSDDDILDIVAFKDQMRDWEDDAEGMLHLGIITYKKLDIGGGAFFHGVDLINNYKITFPTPGNYQIIGNIGGDILATAGVYVERIKASAFASFATGSGMSTGEQTQLREVHERLDLDAAKPNTYQDDASAIAGSDFDLTNTDNLNGSHTVQRS